MVQDDWKNGYVGQKKIRLAVNKDACLLNKNMFYETARKRFASKTYDRSYTDIVLICMKKSRLSKQYYFQTLRMNTNMANINAFRKRALTWSQFFSFCAEIFSETTQDIFFKFLQTIDKWLKFVPLESQVSS